MCKWEMMRVRLLLFMMVALRFSLKGNKKCILLSLPLYLNYQNYKFLNKLFHIHISRNNKNLNIFTFWFHIARNQSSFSRYNGINPVLATFRFSIFAGLYLFTCFHWNSGMEPRGTEDEKYFHQRSFLVVHPPSKNFLFRR